MKNWWKTVLAMALPLVHAAGEDYRNQDDNDTGKDDIIGFALLAVADIASAVLTGDTKKIQTALDKAGKVS